ncbi:MAG: DNA internalization-related competence protein ComEC/Rec2 [Chloroflexi bacterium]|nr:DNA internalization-related competence protein ComEC/Rec2 [Chloroflexota bacterium]
MTLIYLAIAWAAGMLLADLINPSWAALGVAGLWAVCIALLEGATAWRRRAALLSLVILAGAVRWQIAHPPLAPDDLAYYNESGPVSLEGYVASDPRPRQTRQQVVIHAEHLTTPDGQVDVSGSVLLTTPLYPQYLLGERVSLSGSLETPAILEGFDYREYLASQGIGSTMRGARVHVLPGSGGSRLARAISRMRARLRETIELIMPHPEAGLLEGIMLGTDHSLPAELEEAFRTAGLTHIVVISGYNVSILLQAWFLGSRQMMHRWAGLIAGIAMLSVFVLLVGPSPPVMRAAIMSGMSVFALLMGRRDWAPASLAFSALLMTAANPLLIHSVSFQLSITATLSLIVLQPRLAAWLDRLLKGAGSSAEGHLASILVESVVATCAAQLTTLPLAWAHFGQVSLLAVLANALVLPVQSLILVPGAIAVVLGTVAPVLGRALGYALWLPLRWTITVARTVQAIPWASLAVPHLPPVGAWALYGLLLLWIWRLPARPARDPSTPSRMSRESWVVLGWLLSVVLLWTAALAQPDGRLHVYALDVGQGDALLVRTPRGRVVLIDGGPDPLVLGSRLGEALPFWEHSLDLVLVTHADSDHTGGLAPLSSHYRIAGAIHGGSMEGNSASQAWERELKAAAVTPVLVSRGDRIRIGECLMTVLHPEAPLAHNDAQDNDRSLVILLEYGQFRMLLTGDAGRAVEDDLRNAGTSLRAAVLKVSHHGAATATSAEFMAAVHPQLAVISVGAENWYGHPAPEVLQRLAEADVTVLRTDEVGTIAIATDGERFWVEAARPAEPLTE